MPSNILLSSSKTEGVVVSYTKYTQRLSFSGYYNTYVYIEGESLTLREFFDKLHITEKDCAKAWNDPVAKNY